MTASERVAAIRAIKDANPERPDAAVHAARKAPSTVAKVGQRWRQTDGYLCDVVGFAENGWPWVRHPNAKSGGHMVNPAWFAQWELIRDA